jgi:fructoselysine 6-kinase
VKTLAVSVGDNCIDHYLPPLNKDFSGGNAVNVAVHMQRAGCPTAYIGAVGNDVDGVKLLKDLRRENVDVSRVKVLPGNTACTQVQLSPSGDRCFVSEDFGPKDLFSLDEYDITFILQHRLVHNTWQGGTEKYLPRFKQSPDLLISQDYGERYSQDFIDQTIPYTDIIFVSLPETSPIGIKDFAVSLKQRGPKVVVVTQGTLGSLAYDGNFYYQPAITVEVVDTLGAGDAYTGAFLAHWLNGESIPASMEKAARTASQVCTHYGGW